MRLFSEGRKYPCTWCYGQLLEISSIKSVLAVTCVICEKKRETHKPQNIPPGHVNKTV